MLFITHDLRVAVTVADTIAVMQRGKIVEVATASDLIHAPKSEYARAPIASVPGRTGDADRRASLLHQRDIA
jgi:peptide/nickel transport system ATP-binding protein